MRTLGLLAVLLTAACGKLQRAPGAATAEDAKRQWNAAIKSSDFRRAAQLLAPGHKEDWLVRVLAIAPAFATHFPVMRELMEQLNTEHGFTPDGLTFRRSHEDSHLKAIQARIDAVEDENAFAEDVLAATFSLARVAMTSYPPLSAVEEIETTTPSYEAVAKIGGRWFILIALPTESETITDVRLVPEITMLPDDDG